MTSPDSFSSPAGAAPVDLDKLLSRFPVAAPPSSTAQAAVTIVLRHGPREVETLLIERAVSPRDPASGQVAFPGGGVERTDSSLAITALRELEEEVGLGPRDLDGPLRYVGTRYAARFRLEIGVFVAGLAPAAASPSPQDAAEVAGVFWMPRSPLRTTHRVPRDTLFGVMDVNATLFEGHVLWGFTRRVLRRFFELPIEEDLVGFGVTATSRDPP